MLLADHAQDSLPTISITELASCMRKDFSKSSRTIKGSEKSCITVRVSREQSQVVSQGAIQT